MRGKGGGKVGKRPKNIPRVQHGMLMHNPPPLHTITCSQHNILKVKEALDKEEPTRKVLYLCLLSASPGNSGSSNISGSVTADMGAGTELCRFETCIHNMVCTSPVFNLLLCMV